MLRKIFQKLKNSLTWLSGAVLFGLLRVGSARSQGLGEAQPIYGAQSIELPDRMVSQSLYGIQLIDYSVTYFRIWRLTIPLVFIIGLLTILVRWIKKRKVKMDNNLSAAELSLRGLARKLERVVVITFFLWLVASYLFTNYFIGVLVDRAIEIPGWPVSYPINWNTTSGIPALIVIGIEVGILALILFGFVFYYHNQKKHVQQNLQNRKA